MALLWAISLFFSFPSVGTAGPLAEAIETLQILTGVSTNPILIDVDGDGIGLQEVIYLLQFAAELRDEEKVGFEVGFFGSSDRNPTDPEDLFGGILGSKDSYFLNFRNSCSSDSIIAVVTRLDKHCWKPVASFDTGVSVWNPELVLSLSAKKLRISGSSLKLRHHWPLGDGGDVKNYGLTEVFRIPSFVVFSEARASK